MNTTYRVYGHRDLCVDIAGDSFQVLGDGTLQITRTGAVVAQFATGAWLGVWLVTA